MKRGIWDEETASAERHKWYIRNRSNSERNGHMSRRNSSCWETKVALKYICIILLPLVILELQLLCVSYLWGISAEELINSVGRFCLLLCVCITCYHRACLVVASWALLRVLWTCACWGLRLIFPLFISVSFCCSIALLVHGSGAVLFIEGVPFASSVCQVTLIIKITSNKHIQQLA